VHFPKGYKCSKAYHDMWPDLERQMLPFIKAKAKKVKRFVHGLDMDDAIQEGRLALLAALIRYDYNKGEFQRYAGKVLDNTYNDMMYGMLMQSRMPRAVVRDYNGEWVEKAQPPLSMNSLMGEMEYESAVLGSPWRRKSRRGLISKTVDPYEGTKNGELEEQAKVFNLKMLNSLTGRDKDVFECRTNPSVDFLKMVQNIGGNIYEPTNLNIAQYLGVDKNAVDWSLYKIRAVFTKMARNKEFSDLFGEVVESNEWPMIHMSTKARHDIEFVKKIIRSRRLDPKPMDGYHHEPDFYQQAGEYSRMIERYPWGIVLVVSNLDVCRTLVIEGKFNPNTGEVFGQSGARETIPVNWYKKLAKEMARGGKDV